MFFIFMDLWILGMCVSAFKTPAPRGCQIETDLLVSQTEKEEKGKHLKGSNCFLHVKAEQRFCKIS